MKWIEINGYEDYDRFIKLIKTKKSYISLDYKDKKNSFYEIQDYKSGFDREYKVMAISLDRDSYRDEMWYTHDLFSFMVLKLAYFYIEKG